MPHTQAKPPILDSEFLGIRAKLIELAATLDRIDRAHGAAAGDARIEKIRRSLASWPAKPATGRGRFR